MLSTVILLQRTFTLLVYAHAGRTKPFELTYFSLLLFVQGRTKRNKEKYATQLYRYV